VETPTIEVYQQTEQKPQNASSDLSLYEFDGRSFKKIANVEFKAKTPQTKEIRKDIEKLIKELIVGNWFHTLKNIDNHTLSSLFEKFVASFKEFSSAARDNEISIVFCFCVIEKKWACLKHFHYAATKGNFEEYVDKFFEIGVKIESGTVTVNDKSGWHVLDAWK
jgi:hypothetical protein